MRIYGTCQEAVKETERDLFEMGIMVHPQTMQDKFVGDNPDFATKELSPYGFSLIPAAHDDKESFLTYLNQPKEWADAEFEERVLAYKAQVDRVGQTVPWSALNPGEAYKLRGNVWNEFLHNGHFSYTYAERFAMQLRRIVDELRVHQDTRQAILQMYAYPLDLQNVGGKARIPCTMHYQFLIREGMLNMLYVMRSNDLLTFFGTDIYMALKLQEFVASELGLKAGKFTYFSGSLHAYQKDMKTRGIF